MELSLAALSGFRPRTGTVEQWNDAYVRVEDYLRAHRIHNRLHQSRLIEAILERAALRHELDPSQHPTTLAAQETERAMQAWFGDLLGESAQASDRLAVQARVALLLADVPTKWPYAFLDADATPPEVRAAVHRSTIQAGPDMAVSSMVPREIDLGTLPEVAGETFDVFERWPLVRWVAIWSVIGGVLLLMFYLTR